MFHQFSLLARKKKREPQTLYSDEIRN
jgi:hypothetical protein